MTTFGSSLMRTQGLKKRSITAVCVCICSIVAASVVYTQQVQQPGEALDLSKYKLSPVYSNDFSKPQDVVFEENLVRTLANLKAVRVSVPDKRAAWIAEGRGGVEIRDGKLRVSPLPFDASGNQIKSEPRSHMVVWSSQIFPADFLAEFEMDPNGSTNGLTIVFFCATGKNGEDLFDTSLPVREADYKNYHSGAIANYSDAYWSRNTDDEASTNRLRKNPGFALVAQGRSLTTGSTEATHQIRILKFGGHIEIEIDRHVVLKWDDTGTPLGAGRIGFRSMEAVSLITYDNFKVWKLSRK
jgi:hypothetical protein